MRIDVYHDLICPWCRIGKANLETALARWEGPLPEIHFQPFLLDADAPASPEPLLEYFQRTKGVSDPAPLFARVEQAGAGAGVAFRFDIAQSVQTREAHRLLLAARPEYQSALLDVLHRVYFEEGANLASHAVLAQAAEEAGLDRAEALELLEFGAGTLELQAALRESHHLVQGGVPFFVFDNRYALSGAQPPEVLLQAMEAAAAAGIS
ncbi:MAG: DsbA family oxidoreductase [Thermomicrobiales bacterium]